MICIVPKNFYATKTDSFKSLYRSPPLIFQDISLEINKAGYKIIRVSSTSGLNLWPMSPASVELIDKANFKVKRQSFGFDLIFFSFLLFSPASSGVSFVNSI